MSEYSNVEYWNDRYARDSEIFEWYQEYSHIKNILNKYINNNNNHNYNAHNKFNILVAGCGTSNLSQDILQYVDNKNISIVNIDYSSVCIDICKKRYINNSSLQFLLSDLRKLDILDNKFDLCVDKGTIDSLMCSEDNEVNAMKAVGEIHRTLKEGGNLLMISHAAPENREYLFKGNNNNPAGDWLNIQYLTIPKPKIDDSEPDEVHYVYVATKNKKK
jgi:ubiquinone/menaquinone biosynthesis C-methylase UbiE